MSAKHLYHGAKALLLGAKLLFIKQMQGFPMIFIKIRGFEDANIKMQFFLLACVFLYRGAFYFRN